MFDPLRTKGKVVLYVSLAFLFGIGLASGLNWTAKTQAAPNFDAAPQITETEVRPALDLSDSFIRVAEEVTPAVVRIDISRPVTVAQREVPQQFRDFFRDRGDGGGQDRQFGGGSGFMISADGYIMTNNHVVQDADEINVRFVDGRVLPAELVGTDPTTDVAVIRVNGSDFPYLPFGSSDDVRVGEWVLAVGNPGFGGASGSLDYTVTAGIISAKGRPLQLLQSELQDDPRYNQEGQNGSWAIEDFIQTDAVINPGNSGGPMVNLRGQVVGINSAIASRTGFYQGYGFAVPIDLAQRVGEDLIEYGAIRRPWLGISMQGLDQVVADGLGLPRVAGARITRISPDGPAEKAGLRQEDVIVKLDGRDISQPGQLQNQIARRRPGDEVEIEIYRDGNPRQLTLRLGEAPINEAVEAPVVAVEEAADTKIGIRVQELDPGLASEYGYDDPNGVVITDVERYSAAWRRQVRVGLKVLEINGTETESQSDVRRALADAEPGQVVRMTLGDNTGASQIFYVRVPN